jgi:hypothetical protein
MQVDEMMRTKTYGQGRVCIIDGCETRLSAYNPSRICALHRGGWKDELKRATRRRRPREQMTRSCGFDSCGREFVTSNPAKKYCSDACRMKAFQARVVAARRGAYGDSLAGVRRAS